MMRCENILPDKSSCMTVPGQSGDKKHRFLSVSETCFHKGKCPFQLSADLFSTVFSLLYHFRKQEKKLQEECESLLKI